MLSRLKALFRNPFSKVFLRSAFPHSGVVLPRVMLLLLLVFPFFLIVSAEYFESLERSGPVGAVVANAALSAMIVSYLVLLAYILKQSRA